MTIDIKECDGGSGIIIETRGRVTDQEFIDSLERHLTHAREKFETYKYILIDHTALTKVDITDETVDYISGLFAETSSVNPDCIVAMVAYVPYGASIDLIDMVSRMREIFVNQSSWETLQFRTRPQAVRWIKGKANDKFGIDDLTFG